MPPSDPPRGFGNPGLSTGKAVYAALRPASLTPLRLNRPWTNSMKESVSRFLYTSFVCLGSEITYSFEPKMVSAKGSFEPSKYLLFDIRYYPKDRSNWSWSTFAYLALASNACEL